MVLIRTRKTGRRIRYPIGDLTPEIEYENYLRRVSPKEYIQYKMKQEIRRAKYDIQDKYRMQYGDDILD
jgi:hypothetical protein